MKLKYLVILLSAPVLLCVLHQIRIIAILGFNLWFIDQLLNIKKAMNIISYQDVASFYHQHGVVIWPSEQQFLSFNQVVVLFLKGLWFKEGTMGILVLFGLILVAVISLFKKSYTKTFGVDDFGGKILILFAGSVTWNFLFMTHAVNYFNATPYIMLAGIINLGLALFFVAMINLLLLKRPKGIARARLLFGAVLFTVLFCQRAYFFLKNPNISVPGTTVLSRYKGVKFYSNIWPLFVSYYTGEWTVGGLHPQDAVKREPLSAKWFLQKDKLNQKKYSQPDYYFYVYWEKVAPFTEAKHKKILDDAFPLMEKGDKWFIYKMNGKI